MQMLDALNTNNRYHGDYECSYSYRKSITDILSTNDTNLTVKDIRILKAYAFLSNVLDHHDFLAISFRCIERAIKVNNFTVRRLLKWLITRQEIEFKPPNLYRLV